MMKKRVQFFLLSIIMVCSFVSAKTLLAPTSKVRTAGHISGKVEIILQSMTFTEEQKKSMLEIEHRNMRALGLDVTEPALFAKIEAFLGLSTVRVSRLKEAAEPAVSPVEKIEKIVAKKEERAVADAHSFMDYAKKVIADAAAYSDVKDIPGMPSVSDQREMTAAMRDKERAQSNNIAAVCASAQVVHEKISFLLTKSEKLQQFVGAFTTHMADRYQVSTNGMTEEILYRVFDVLACADVHSQISLAEYIGNFLVTYNSYVSEEEQVAAEELAVPVAQWAATIQKSDDAQKHIMLLLSWAMELVKRTVKQDAAFTHQYEALVERTAQAAEQLTHMGVEFDQDKVNEPLYMATVCGEQVEQMVLKVGSPDKLEQKEYEKAERLVQIAEQISQLTNDYDMVVRQRADSSSMVRAQEDVAQLPADQQEVLMQELQDQMMSGSLPPEVAQMMGIEQPQKKSSKGALIGLAVGAAVVTGLLEFGGRASDGKTEGFFGLFNKVGYPTKWAGGAYHRIFGKKNSGAAGAGARKNAQNVT